MQTETTFFSELKRLSYDKKNNAVVTLSFVFFALATLLVLPLWISSPWYYALSWIPIGILQYRVVIAGHEAVHKTLCQPLFLNEALGAFTQALVGVNFSAYRLQHFEHHRSSNYENDPDGYIYSYVVKSKPGLERLFNWIFGIALEILTKIYQKGVGGFGNRREQSEKTKSLKTRHSFYILLAQAILFVGSWAITGFWFGYILLWFGPLISVAVFLNRSRILVEHGFALVLTNAGVFSPTTRIPTVDLIPSFIERLLFAPFHFNFHSSHHLFPHVPYYNLAELSQVCKQNEVNGFFRLEQGYFKSLRMLIMG
jgi:fatty acid desaturase